ncbi:Transposase [Shigella dysenteriae 1617]|uniref:Transposase n=1 Tax=Shigella dysenteriae 1617 TaxID=754093 RepID=A0A0A6ZS77_SHIDY|nr:Transposase [Shigella dysenteriae 1617]
MPFYFRKECPLNSGYLKRFFNARLTGLISVSELKNN